MTKYGVSPRTPRKKHPYYVAWQHCQPDSCNGSEHSSLMRVDDARCLLFTTFFAPYRPSLFLHIKAEGTERTKSRLAK